MLEFEITVLFYGFLAGIATLSGIIMIRWKQDWAMNNSGHITSFAAGLMLALVFFHLMPEAIELSDIAPQIIFLGFFGFYLLENFLMINSGIELPYCVDEDEPHSHLLPITGVMTFSGLAFHSLIDGIIIGVGFEISTEIGILASIAVIAHEVPEGITSFALINETLPERAIFLSVIVAIATPFGALISLLFIRNISDSLVGLLLALGAGTFVYVAASDLIPKTHQNQSWKSLIAFFVGMFFIILLAFVK